MSTETEASAGTDVWGDAEIPPLTFDLPAVFRQVYPAVADESAQSPQARELAQAGLGEPVTELMAELLAATGVEFAATGLFRDEDDAVVHCTLTVAAVPSDHTSPEVAASGLREIFLRDTQRDTRWLDLPCGPAVAVVTLRVLTLPAPSPELPIGQIQVHVPFPDAPWIAVLTMESTGLEQWEQVSSLMAAAVRSIRFPGAALSSTS